MSTIEFTHVTHRFGERTVLRDIHLTLTERRVGIVGANGSGKSTLARMINGLVTPEEGTVTVAGLDVVTRGREVRRQVGFVFTNPDSQIVMPTVREDVAFTLRRHKLTPAVAAARVAATLDRFGLTEYAEHPAHLLSGGQKQLLALAAILVAQPQILVADEPTTLLDARNAQQIAEVLTGLDQQIVVVTHHLDLLVGFDRIIVIDEGCLVADDTPEAALRTYRSLLS